MLDQVRASIWRHARALELNGYYAECLWLYALAAWLPW